MLTIALLADGYQPLKNVTRESFFNVTEVLGRHPDFVFHLTMWLLCYIIFWFYLSSVGDNRVYTFIYKYVQTGVIHWVEMGSKCNLVHHNAYDNFLLFLQLNRSVNGLKPRIYYILLQGSEHPYKYYYQPDNGSPLCVLQYLLFKRKVT